MHLFSELHPTSLQSLLAEIRPMKKTEIPLKLHLQYGVHSPYLDIRLVQVRDSRGEATGNSNSDDDKSVKDDSDDSKEGGIRSLVPKEEGE